jgi:hypothetical protein
LAKFEKCIIAVRSLTAGRRGLASFDLNQLGSCRPQLVIKWAAVGFLDDDFRLHAGQVRELTDQGLVIAGQNTG